MSEFEIAIALFDFIKTFELSVEQQVYFDTLKKAWNDLQDEENEEMNECVIPNCGYYWQDEGEDHPSCHYPSDSPFPAPCEEDDWDTEPAEEEDEDYE